MTDILLKTFASNTLVGHLRPSIVEIISKSKKVSVDEHGPVRGPCFYERFKLNAIRQFATDILAGRPDDWIDGVDRPVRRQIQPIRHAPLLNTSQPPSLSAIRPRWPEPPQRRVPASNPTVAAASSLGSGANGVDDDHRLRFLLCSRVGLAKMSGRCNPTREQMQRLQCEPQLPLDDARAMQALFGSAMAEVISDNVQFYRRAAITGQNIFSPADFAPTAFKSSGGGGRYTTYSYST